MICPFRVNVEFEYIKLPPDKDGEPQFLEKSQKQIYAGCEEDRCPFYDYSGGCKRADAMVD